MTFKKWLIIFEILHFRLQYFKPIGLNWLSFKVPDVISGAYNFPFGGQVPPNHTFFQNSVHSRFFQKITHPIFILTHCIMGLKWNDHMADISCVFLKTKTFLTIKSRTFSKKISSVFFFKTQRKTFLKIKLKFYF